MNPRVKSQTPQKPVAYDANGQPLYAAPVDNHPVDASQVEAPSVDQRARSSHVTAAPESHDGHAFNPRLRTQYANEPQVVHETRGVDPKGFEISDRVRDRHDKSKRRYPHLNLSDGEYVILDIKRHPIGLLMPVFAGGIVLVALALALIVYPADTSMSRLPDFGAALLICSLIMILVGIGTFIAVWVYLQNQFFMTNESVIQEIQHSLFSKHEQTVSLGSIEDASFKQTGILQTMFNYGQIRLSTEGEETTYRFAYVSDPRSQVAVINNGIEAFKNGRPVEDPHDT
ncbi:PH domain-containing protein [Candidatus Nomurabacteria bacterium]|nr:PH domain-containing protein [Candidatus Nomurabacteria bacterium]